MSISGNLLKMESIANTPIDYYLYFNDEKHHVNDWIGKSIAISYKNVINCVACGKHTNKSFFQGHCYKCFSTLPQTDSSVMNPELCMAQEGISRDMDWSKKNCLIDHYVYLSVTSNVKVGVTRSTQIPTRWIDQGAEYGIILAQTPYRQLAGLIEVELKQYMNDKTNWRKMLTSGVTDVPDLLSVKDEMADLLPDDYQQFLSEDDTIHHLQYPVNEYPDKVKSVNLEKTPEFKGLLKGIKGQYLIFDDGFVLNVRKHNGFLVDIIVSEASKTLFD